MAEAEDKLLADLEKLAPGDRKARGRCSRSSRITSASCATSRRPSKGENKELPEEFLNSDALKNLDLDDLLQDIAKIRDLLGKGDIAGAKRAAKALAAKLAELRNRLRQAREEFDDKADKALSRLDGKTLPSWSVSSTSRRRCWGARTRSSAGRAALEGV